MSKSDWQHRVTDDLEERLGLKDSPFAMKFRKHKIFHEPKGDLPKRDLTAFGFTSGVGSMLWGAHEAGFAVAGNVEWRDYYRWTDPEGETTFTQNFPGAFMARGFRDAPRDLIPSTIDYAVGHPECLPGETVVFTSKGWKPIKEVQVGDLVITHRGRFQEVARTIEKPLAADDEIVTLRVELPKGGEDSLVITSNHPVMTQYGWIPAGEIGTDDELSILDIEKSLVNYEFSPVKIIAIEKTGARVGDLVYNLTVAEDSSYIAKGFVVKNCGFYSNLSGSLNREGVDRHTGRKSDMGDLPLFLKYIAEYQPRFFLMDDLPGSLEAMPISDYAKALPEYDLFPEWISNWGYGNIQKHRNRMFIVGALKKERFVFLPGEAAHDLVMHNVIGDLYGVEPGTVPNHQWIDLDRVPGRFVNMRYYGDRPSYRETLHSMDLDPICRNNKPYYTPDGFMKVRPGTLDPKWDGYCPTLSGGYSPFHPLEPRLLSIRERARIQGFPDSFVFHHSAGGPYAETWCAYSSDGNRGVKQTGKAMPLHFCGYVARQVKAHIEQKPFQTTGVRILKPNPKVDVAKKEYCENFKYADQERACSNCWIKSCDHRAMKSTWALQA